MSTKAKLLEKIIDAVHGMDAPMVEPLKTKAKIKYCDGCKKPMPIGHIHVDLPTPMHPKMVAKHVRDYAEGLPDADVAFLETLATIIEAYSPAWEKYSK